MRTFKIASQDNIRSHSLSLGISASPSLEQLGGRIDLVDFGYLLHKNIGLSAKVGASVYEVSSVSINGVPQYDDARLILGRVLAGGLFSFSTGKHGRIELKPMIGLGWASVTKVATSSAMFAWEAGAQYRLHLGRSTDLMTGLSYSGLGEFTDFALTLGFAFRRLLHNAPLKVSCIFLDVFCVFERLGET